jgi:hypothetical protein
VKAKSTSLTLYHFADGHHREVCLWHDQDHKPEVLGAMDHIFISQRWVATPDLADARSTTLPRTGGQYVNLYWSTGTTEELEYGFGTLGRRLERVGRMEPMQYLERTWGGRLEPVSLHTRSGLPLSAEAVLCAPQNTGLFVVIGELVPGPHRAAYARWHETEHIRDMLDSGLFIGAAKLMSSNPDERDLMVVLYYSDRPDPVATYAEMRRVAPTWSTFPNADAAFRRIHNGMYRPSMGFYDYYA